MSETTGIDMYALARDLLKWEAMRRKLDELEAAIKDTVLQLGETQTVGNVRATYNQGRKKYDHEAAIHIYEQDNGRMPDTFWAGYRKVDHDWRAMAEALKLEDVPYTQTAPSVSIKLLD